MKERAQDPVGIRTRERHTITHHASLDVVVEQEGDQRILYRAHHDHIIRELIALVPAFAQFMLQRMFLIGIDLINEQHLEIVLLVTVMFVDLFFRAALGIRVVQGVVPEGATYQITNNMSYCTIERMPLFGIDQLQ